MFTRIEIEFSFGDHHFRPGQCANLGKIGAMEAYKKALSKRQTVKAPQNKMVGTDELRKG